MNEMATILRTFHHEYTNSKQTRPYSTTEILRRMPRGLKNRLTHDETDVNTWPESTLEMLEKLDAITPSTRHAGAWVWTQNGRNARRDLIRNWERLNSRSI